MGHTYKSIVINAPVEKVWAKLRNFHDMSWAKGVIEDVKAVGSLKSDQVGAQRVLNGVFSETLLELNDHDHRVSYSIDDGPGTPVAKDVVKNYVGTVQALPVTEGSQTFVQLHSSWDGNDSVATEFCGGVYTGMVTALKKSCE